MAGGAKKGEVRNPGGRPRGTQNKITKEAKQIIKECLDDLSPQLPEKFKQLDPRDWVALYCKLAEFVIPRMGTITPEVSDDGNAVTGAEFVS